MAATVIRRWTRYEDVGGRTKLFVAPRDIAAGEEITANYGGPTDGTPGWLDALDSAPPRPVESIDGTN